MFWNTFVNLCIKNHTKPNPVAKAIGISSGAVTNWKNGAMPSSTTIKKIADYFGVSVDVFNESEQKEKPTPEGELLQDLLVLHRNGERIEYHLSEEQLKAIKPLLDQLNSQKDPDI